jgi:hypothetical protein
MSGIPEIYSKYSDAYRRIYVADMFGGIVPAGVEAVVYSEERDIEKALESHPVAANRTRIKRTIECELLIDPMQMKSIHKWLGLKIKEFEQAFGNIPSPEEVESRRKRGTGSNEPAQ